MPWCADCDRFLSPSTVRPDGSCPTCGHPVESGRAHPPAGVVGAHPSDDGEDLPAVPWHLKLLVAAVALYLGWRAFQGLEWLVRQL